MGNFDYIAQLVAEAATVSTEGIIALRLNESELCHQEEQCPGQ